MLHVDVVHHNAHADYMSRHGDDLYGSTHSYLTMMHLLQPYAKHTPPIGPILQENMPGYHTKCAIPKAPRVASAYFGVVDEHADTTIPP